MTWVSYLISMTFVTCVVRLREADMANMGDWANLADMVYLADFHRIGPLCRFGLVVAMSVYV